ncbi:MAG: ABC transporter ATP-binding protein [Hyphomonadaceae bacterium]|jgi:branched-chain amino acid transport system ATP-binding protein|nr:ABC transporter ATP-binding protein [Hyphomonadaceae bacterium]
MPASSPSAPILAGQKLNTYYGQSHILRDVSLAIRAGETIGLMGRNGMGKTTLIRTLVGLVRARSGSVEIDGRDVTRTPAHTIARRGIAYVPEGRGIFASLSVAENMAIAERPGPGGGQPWTRPRVLELFPRLGQRLANRGDQLSGGEQQMLAIGRALLTNPRLIILDEATEGLAPIVRDEIWKTIRLIRATGMATLIVDKTVSAVAEIADRVVILVKGETVFDGAPPELTANPEFMHRHLGV